MTSHTTEARVIAAFQEVFKNKGLAAPSLTATSRLDGSLGLESLDFAEIVVRLEGEFGKDPFSGGMPQQITTLGDLVALYE